MRGQILAAWPLIPACAGGTAQREQQLDAVVRAIDFASLARGDPAFDAS